MIYYLGFCECYFARQALRGMHFQERSVLTKKNNMSIKKMYDKNYRPVSLSTTGFLLWNLDPGTFFFENDP